MWMQSSLRSGWKSCSQHPASRQRRCSYVANCRRHPPLPQLQLSRLALASRRGGRSSCSRRCALGRRPCSCSARLKAVLCQQWLASLRGGRTSCSQRHAWRLRWYCCTAQHGRPWTACLQQTRFRNGSGSCEQGLAQRRGCSPSHGVRHWSAGPMSQCPSLARSRFRICRSCRSPCSPRVARRPPSQPVQAAAQLSRSLKQPNHACPSLPWPLPPGVGGASGRGPGRMCCALRWPPPSAPHQIGLQRPLAVWPWPRSRLMYWPALSEKSVACRSHRHRHLGRSRQLI
mmetsp:Transcript_66498/g.214280  ORF Transcript_66498/g.214280 Transcript_66498/m.214280 type:complete len:287 (+) Transcript_66498:1471-2331(+)